MPKLVDHREQFSFKQQTTTSYLNVPKYDGRYLLDETKFGPLETKLQGLWLKESQFVRQLEMKNIF